MTSPDLIAALRAAHEAGKSAHDYFANEIPWDDLDDSDQAQARYQAARHWQCANHRTDDLLALIDSKDAEKELLQRGVSELGDLLAAARAELEFRAQDLLHARQERDAQAARIGVLEVQVARVEALVDDEQFWQAGRNPAVPVALLRRALEEPKEGK